MSEHPSIVVVGSGAAGSLLVRALDDAGLVDDVRLIDRSPSPLLHRAWASWEGSDADPVPGARTFRRVRVAGARGQTDHVLVSHRYAVHDGAELARAADDALRSLGGSRWLADAREIRAGDRSAVVRTTAGDLRCDLCFDSVGVSVPEQAEPRAWLHFSGWRVRFERDVLDPDVVTLMDFRVPQRGAARFMYVLPSSAREALVELTSFSTCAQDSGVEDDLRAYVGSMSAGDAWTAERIEGGPIPLRPLRPRRRHGRHIVIGTAAGLVRASTGYGYGLMARDAEAIAADLATGRRPRGLRRRRRHAWMDEVFLELLATDPPSLVDALETLFARNPVDRVVRFLDEESSLLDEARIIVSLPPARFLRAIGRLALRRPWR